ncbi:hypothetical protein ACKGJO_05860 [Gracilimonas sp. Q87]|uniref:hypothetical protein n=1 Tax=Gracilimonas sp. Q87 TaxID=3384766 RepID=UPI0039840529
MRLKRTYLFVFGLLFWLCSFNNFGHAQPTLGVIWDVPDDNRTIAQQLELFNDMGITHLELNHPVSTNLLSELETKRFSILIRSDQRYYTLGTLLSKQDSFQENVSELIRRYRDYSRVAALGVISQSHFKNTEFTSAITSISERFTSQTDKTLYHYLNKKWFTLDALDLPFGILLGDNEYQSRDLKEFDQKFRTYVDNNDEMIVFMHSEWVTYAANAFPEFQNSLKLYRQDGIWSLPLPDQNSPTPEPNWLVFALLVFWIILAVQFKFIPNARPMVLRYYFAHRFYVDDILHYRERYATQSIMMMVVHALAGGVVAYLTTTLLVSEAGLEALIYHLPWLDYFGNGYISISLISIAVILIFQAVSILWLYLPAKNLDHVSQTINLYAGLLYTDYITLTLLISFYLTDFSTALVIILATFYLLIGFINFYLTSYNTARNLGPEKIIYFFITAALYTVIAISVLVFLITQTQIIDILSLSISL